MTIADVKPGGWASHELLSSAQMNAIRTELLKCVDGSGGGTYTLSALLRFQGAALQVEDLNVDDDVAVGGDLSIAGALTLSGDVHVTTGNTLFLDTGSALDVSDNAFFSGVTVFDGSHVDLVSGTPLRVDSLDDLVVQSENRSMRLPLTPIARSIDTTNPDVHFWGFSDALGGWLNTNPASASFITFALPVNAGDVINSITATVKGGASAGHGGVDPTFKMSIGLYEGPASGSGGAYSLVTIGSDPATGAAYDANHFFSISPAYTALERYYIVKFGSEFGGTAAANENLLYTIQALITRNRVVSGNTFGS